MISSAWRRAWLRRRAWLKRRGMAESNRRMWLRRRVWLKRRGMAEFWRLPSLFPVDNKKPE